MVLAASSLGLVVGLTLVWRYLGPRNILGAFALCLLPTSWTFCTKRYFRVRLPASYYGLKRWEKDGRCYEALGIRRFQRLLRLPPLRILNMDITRRFSQRDYGAAACEMRNAETSHALALLFALSVTVLALVRRWWDGVAYLLVFNVLVNAYPIMLQRYNRGRLARLASRPGARTR